MLSKYDLWLTKALGTNVSNATEITESTLTPQQLYNQRESLGKLNIFTARQLKRLSQTDISDIENDYAIYSEIGADSICYADENYPQRFKNMSSPPLVIYYQGDISLFRAQYTVGIVGSRQCTGEGERAGQKIAADIVHCGGVVVSGLAQGIDSIAQKTAVAENGRTIAFLGTPLGEYFPKTNKEFQKKLAAEQLVISEYLPTQEYYGVNFISRNRLIAAASDALCVIQAKEKSGSLATVNRAREYDRPVFTIPGSIFSDSFSGSNRLLYDGLAYATDNGTAIMRYLGYSEKNVAVQCTLDTMGMSDEEFAVYNAIDGTAYTAQIIKNSGLNAGIVKAILTQFEIDGIITKSASGEYIKEKKK